MSVKINFYEGNPYFKHKDTDLIVEFPADSLSVGEEPIKEIITLHTDTVKEINGKTEKV
jgi:hypothetical protein